MWKAMTLFPKKKREKEKKRGNETQSSV